MSHQNNPQYIVRIFEARYMLDDFHMIMLPKDYLCKIKKFIFSMCNVFRVFQPPRPGMPCLTTAQTTAISTT